MNVILNPVVSERITKPGFYMNLHRDDYHLDYYKFKKGVRDHSLWVPIYNIEKRPVVSVLWYQSTQGIDFIGAWIQVCRNMGKSVESFQENYSYGSIKFQKKKI